MGAHAVVVWEGYQLNRKRTGSRYGLSLCGSAHAVSVDEDLLAIGAFARPAVSVSSGCVHYDDMGLLVPAWFDPDELPVVAAALAEFDTVHGLGITGKGEPGGPAHLESIEILVGVAGPLIDLARQSGVPFAMPPMERRLTSRNREPWRNWMASCPPCVCNRTVFTTRSTYPTSTRQTRRRCARFSASRFVTRQVGVSTLRVRPVACRPTWAVTEAGWQEPTARCCPRVRRPRCFVGCGLGAS